MPEMFDYSFMRYAFLAGLGTAISAAVLGNFVVAARQAVVSDMLAHVAMVGVGLGIVWELSPTAMAFAVTVVAALALWQISGHGRRAPEAYAMLLLTGGLALALLLAHANKDNPISLESYLFGSLLTITRTELISFSALNLGILAAIALWWRQLITLVFDASYLRITRPRSAKLFGMLFILMLAAMVGMGLKVIGGLLLGALLVIPVLAARPFARSFLGSVFLSIGINLACTAAGIAISFYADIPTSSAIVLSLVACFCASALFSAVRLRLRPTSKLQSTLSPPPSSG